MEPSSYQGSETESCRSDDSAFAKTPIRAESELSPANNSSCDDSSSSGASAHINDCGDKTYFHVWSDMLTCQEMALLDQKAAQEVPEYVEGDEQTRDVHKPLSIDTSLPCPLIQFGPIPKKRRAPVEPAPSKPTVASAAKELAGDISATSANATAVDPAPSSGHNHLEGEAHSADERCCDFTLIAAENKARLKRQEKLRRREQKRLVRY